MFVHYGYEAGKDMKPGVFRANVAIWTGKDSLVTQLLGEIPGSERWGQSVNGVLRGTRPLPLGKQSVIAIGEDRFFVGTADTYEIIIRDLAGRQIGTIRKPSANLATTKADVEFVLQREQAGQSEAAQKRIADSYATMELPKTIPAYTKMLIDSEGLLWVQDYPRGKSAVSRWSVFSPAGAQRAEVLLPANLDLYEVGPDYVLGRYIDPDEQIPQIRTYHLRRAGRRP